MQGLEKFERERNFSNRARAKTIFLSALNHQKVFCLKKLRKTAIGNYLFPVIPVSRDGFANAEKICSIDAQASCFNDNSVFTVMGLGLSSTKHSAILSVPNIFINNCTNDF